MTRHNSFDPQATRDPIERVVRQIIAEAVPWQFASARVDVPRLWFGGGDDTRDFDHLFTWHIRRELTPRQAEEREKLKALSDAFLHDLEKARSM